MKLKLQNKISPIFIGIFLILSIAVTIFLIQEGILLITRARPTAIPQNIRITNVSDNSFTIVFTTELNAPAALRLPEGRTGNTIILDDRDKSSGLQNPYFSHHITVPNLEPQKTYSFAIISNGKEYSSPGEYIVTTGPQIESAPPAQRPLYGTVLLPNGSKGADTIVIAQAEDSQIVSSVTNSDGNYILPVNSLKNEQLSDYQVLTDSSQIALNFFRENFTSKIITDYKLSQNLPVITLNQSYSFFPQEGDTRVIPQHGFESIEEVVVSSSEPTVISPQEDQSFIDQRPTFSGTGGTGRKVTVDIESLDISETIDISNQGRWSFRPEESLPQGTYDIKLTIQDENGTSSIVERSFSILPSGSQVTETATPSATPIFTPTPTQTPITPTPTLVNPTVTPEISQQPTPTVTLIPTQTPEPTISTAPTLIPTATPLPPIEKPGDFYSTTVLTIISIVLIVSGAVIFFAL